MPALLALSAVHTRLSAAGLRTRCSLLVESDEPRDTHAIACLLGYGADVVCPRLALETVAALAADDRVGGDRPSPAEAQARLFSALEEGVLKVMSKMGISDVASYRGARLFDAVGLAATPLPRRPRRHAVGDRRREPRPLRAGGAGTAPRLRRGASAAREPGLLQVPQGRRAACHRSGRRRCAPGGRRRSARAAHSGARRSLGSLRALRRHSSTSGRRSSRATCSSSSRRASPCRSTRSSRPRRSSAASRAGRCPTARSRRRRTRRSRSR